MMTECAVWQQSSTADGAWSNTIGSAVTTQLSRSSSLSGVAITSWVSVCSAARRVFSAA